MQHPRWIIALLLFIVPATLYAENISIKVYELEDYIRHPRMEEEDQLKGGNPAYRPGLEIISDIDDVEIRFFEESVGYTPAEWDNLSSGAYRVRMERTGYEIIEFWVQVQSDRRTVVFVEMGNATGTLVLHNIPENAEVSVNRIPVDGNIAELASGPGNLMVNAFGWKPVVETIEIAAGRILEWSYAGEKTSFALYEPQIRPSVLPAGDRRGFRIDWRAAGPGSADIRIYDYSDTEYTAIPFGISTGTGTVYWSPSTLEGYDVPEGEYRVVLAGTGYDDTRDSAESTLAVDNRFKREPRPLMYLLPGLMYAPGTAMLPPGIWQVATGAGIDIDTGSGAGYAGVPAGLGIRVAPGKRWELSGRFGMKARDPFDDTSLYLSLSGTWRMVPSSGQFQANLSLLYHHEGMAVDFAAIPEKTPGMALPGLQLSVPMEYAIGDFSIVLTPSANLFFAGNDPSQWRLAPPARFAGSLGSGIYYETGRYLAGFSTAVRSPDVSGDILDWTMWSALEGRFDLPGEASYFAGWCGMRYLDTDPVISLGVEFGMIR